MTQQAPIEIPLVKSLAEVGDPCENIVATLHFLLGALMSRSEHCFTRSGCDPQKK